MNYRKSTMPEGEEYWQLEGKFMNHSFLAVLNKEQRAIMADPKKHGCPTNMDDMDKIFGFINCNAEQIQKYYDLIAAFKNPTKLCTPLRQKFGSENLSNRRKKVRFTVGTHVKVRISKCHYLYYTVDMRRPRAYPNGPWKECVILHTHPRQSHWCPGACAAYIVYIKEDKEPTMIFQDVDDCIVLNKEHLKICDYCGKNSPQRSTSNNNKNGKKKKNLKLKKCKRCLETYYCDSKCQKNDWGWHKKFCKEIILGDYFESDSVGHKYSLEELQAGVSHSHNGVPCHQNH